MVCSPLPRTLNTIVARCSSIGFARSPQRTAPWPPRGPRALVEKPWYREVCELGIKAWNYCTHSLKFSRYFKFWLRKESIFFVDKISVFRSFFAHHCKSFSGCIPQPRMGVWISCFFFWYFARNFWESVPAGHLQSGFPCDFPLPCDLLLMHILNLCAFFHNAKQWSILSLNTVFPPNVSFSGSTMFLTQSHVRPRYVFPEWWTIKYSFSCCHFWAT